MLLFSIKVKVSLQGSCHRYGMIAVDNIKKGECLFEIPRSLLLKPESSSISGILENLTYKSRIALNRRYIQVFIFVSCYSQTSNYG